MRGKLLFIVAWIVYVYCSSVCTKACWIRNGSVVMCVVVELGEERCC
jgi:hypothetical protein